MFRRFLVGLFRKRTCGVGLNFVRQLEQGKPTLRMDKVNQVLAMFGYELAPVRTDELNEKS